MSDLVVVHIATPEKLKEMMIGGGVWNIGIFFDMATYIKFGSRITIKSIKKNFSIPQSFVGKNICLFWVKLSRLTFTSSQIEAIKDLYSEDNIKMQNEFELDLRKKDTLFSSYFFIFKSILF